MHLKPDCPPGRSTRKALVFADEIARLRAEGYSLDAIRKALAGAGVHVSKSTVQREAARHRSTRPGAGAAAMAASEGTGEARAPPLASAPVASASHVALPGASLASGPRSGRDIARAFVDGRITNPLLRTREPR